MDCKTNICRARNGICKSEAAALFGRGSLPDDIFFDPFGAPRLVEGSTSIESASKNPLSKRKEKSTARSRKIVRSPKTAMRRFLPVNIERTL